MAESQLPPDLPDMYASDQDSEVPNEESLDVESERTEEVNESEDNDAPLEETVVPTQTISQRDEDRIYNKTRQQLMQELGNWRRNTLDPIRDQMTTLSDELKSRKVPDAENAEQLVQADEISSQLDDVLKNGYVDEQTHGVLTSMAKRLNALARTSESPVTKEIQEKVEHLDTMMARQNDHIKAVKYWENFNQENEDLEIDGRSMWLEAQKVVSDRGLKGEQAYGAATMLFEDAIDLAKEKQGASQTDDADPVTKATSGSTKKGAIRTKTRGASTSRSSKTGPELDADGLPVGMYTSG